MDFWIFFGKLDHVVECLVETALNNSYAKFVAYDGDKPVGMVRIIGDGGMSFYIKDYAVIPEYQSKGVGKALMQFLEDYIRILCLKIGQ